MFKILMLERAFGLLELLVQEVRLWLRSKKSCINELGPFLRAESGHNTWPLFATGRDP